MDNSLETCLQYLKEQRNITVYDNVELKNSMFHLFKNECFDSSKYKWKSTLYDAFVQGNNLMYEYCYEVLKLLLATYREIKPFERGEPGFKEFVEAASKKPDNVGKIKVSTNNETQFLAELRQLKEKYFKDYPTGKYIDFIHKNFQIGNNQSVDTVRRKYYER